MSISRQGLLLALFLAGCGSPRWHVIQVDPETQAKGDQAMTEAMDHWRRSTGQELEQPVHTFGRRTSGEVSMGRRMKQRDGIAPFIVFFPDEIPDGHWLGVAVHELGHQWGLGHESKEGLLMSEVYASVDCVDWPAAIAYGELHKVPAVSTCPTPTDLVASSE
jgi:hypothetical protein